MICKNVLLGRGHHGGEEKKNWSFDQKIQKEPRKHM